MGAAFHSLFWCHGLFFSFQIELSNWQCFFLVFFFFFQQKFTTYYYFWPLHLPPYCSLPKRGILLSAWGHLHSMFPLCMMFFLSRSSCSSLSEPSQFCSDVIWLSYLKMQTTSHPLLKIFLNYKIWRISFRCRTLCWFRHYKVIETTVPISAKWFDI